MYLLLRNNKQSGPYSLDELKSMGLKAYDLVWLEGKSAAWRYPCEIEDLRAFAPAVEEQPFDRFFKKPGQNAAAAISGSNDAAVAVNGSNGVVVAVKPAVETAGPAESPVLTGKRIIYVNLPAGRPGPATLRDTPIREVSREAERPRNPITETASVPIVAPAFGDYPSRPALTGISTGESAPRRRSQRSDRLFRILAVGVCILALLAAGIFIGLSLNKDNLGLQQRIASKTGSTQLTHPAVQTSVPPPAISVANSTVPANSAQKAADPAGLAVNGGAPPIDGTAISNKVARTRRTKEKDKTAQMVVPPVTKDSALEEVPVISREAVHRTDMQSAPADNKEAAKTAIASQVSVGANGYSVGTFGGINDLQLTVTNRSTYPLDLVVVEVRYVQANKKIYKTQNLYFHDIGPGAALMQEAPKSSRGIRVQYKITSISSKELGLSYSGI